MDSQAQKTPAMEKLAQLIGHARIAMLTTAEPEGALRSRPLATLQMDSEGALWFFSSLSSPKMQEIARHAQISLSYSDPDRHDYVSVSGTAEVVRDRERIRALWTEWVQPWFPRGLEDPIWCCCGCG